MGKFLRHLNFLFIILSFGVFAPISAYADDQPEDAILILDASGSMWGQIDGKNKITIARSVISQLLDDLPANRRLGLMAYGHNKKGDCSDIEMLAKVGASRADMKAAIKNINPKGKTPISAAVKQAAELLKYTETKATVILISDGIETCNLDPCALGKQLEKDGVDFTAHVVGFDIIDKKTEEQLQCLAASTGGRYLSASSASDLSIALGETVKSKRVGLAPIKLHLAATLLEKGESIETGLNWKVQQSGGGKIVYEIDNAGAVTGNVPPGVYDVFVIMPEDGLARDGLAGESRLVELKPGANKAVTIILNPEFDASVNPERQTVSAGTKFIVNWTGPNRKSDFITVTKPNVSARDYTSYAYTANGNPLTLTAPILAGEYEVRYVLGRPYKILARTPIKVNTEAASIKAPETAAGGDTIQVQWSGPSTQSDFVTVVNMDAKPRAYTQYFYTKNSASPHKLRMPLEPGAYEIRYIFVGKTSNGTDEFRIIARQEIRITQVQATIKGPSTANVGETLNIDWAGPSEPSDFITVTKPEARQRKYMDYAYTKNGSPAKISMPLTPGDYELRFVQNNTKIIARQPITITDISVTLDAPKTAKASAEISVGFTGPANRGDWITIVSPDARPTKYGDYFYPKNGNPQKLTIPKQPGDYEIRYVLKGKRIVARQNIEVTK